MIALAAREAEAVHKGAPVAFLLNYVRALVAGAAHNFNEITRGLAFEAAGLVKAPPPGQLDPRVAADVFRQAEMVRSGSFARSVSTSTAGFARVDTARRSGMSTKTWVTGANPRPEHSAMNGSTVPCGQPFPNGKQWPSGKNCNCRVSFSGGAEYFVKPLTLKEMDIPLEAMSRTRLVSNTEYQSLAYEGAQLLSEYRSLRSAPVLDMTIANQMWDSIQDPWGGLTVDAHTGIAVAADADAYAITVKASGQESVMIPLEGLTREQFDAAYREALERFGNPEYGQLWNAKVHLGVFRDEGAGRIDFDPVLVVDSREEMERIGAFTRARGGAYHFKSGDGYWPPHVGKVEPPPSESLVPSVNRLAELPAKQHDVVVASLDKYGIADKVLGHPITGPADVEAIIDKIGADIDDIIKSMDPRLRDLSSQWYFAAHDWAHKLARQTGYTAEEVAGALAKCSAQTNWNDNRLQVRALFTNLRRWQREGKTDDEIATLVNREMELSGASKGGGLKRNTILALRMLREDEPSPGKISFPTFSGKTRSFYNNIIHPAGAYDATMDGHMMKMFTRLGVPKKDVEKWFDAGGKGQIGAGRIILVEAIMRRLPPGELAHMRQAEVWTEIVRLGNAMQIPGRRASNKPASTVEQEIKALLEFYREAGYRPR